MTRLQVFKAMAYFLCFIIFSWSNVFGMGDEPPSPPLITASDGAHNDKVVITWSGTDEADYYHIIRSEADGSLQIGGNVTATFYEDHDVEWENIYTYKVKAFFADSESDYSTPDDGYAGDFDYTDLSIIREDFFPTREELWEDLNKMVDLGPRLTGNSAHKQMLDYLEQDMQAMGFETYRDRISFKRWDASQYGITIIYPDGTRHDVPVASYWPRSGETPPEGITAPLASSHLWGKIALDDYDLNYLLSLTVSDIYLQKYKLLNAKGIILIRDEEYNAIKGDYYPFNGGFVGIPTLFVDKATGQILKDAESDGASVTLTLAATVEDDTTDHLYGFLKGRTDDTVIMGLHSDGQNALEENGIPAIMGIAEYFSQIPKQFRNKTIGIVFSTGHMTPMWEQSDNDMEIAGWCHMHPDILEKTVAAISPEHFAALKAEITPSGTYEATTEPYTYHVTPSTESLWDVCEPLAQGRHAMDCGIIDVPLLKYLMVGSALGWLENKVPVVGGMALDGLSGPHYLTNMETGGLDKIDKDLFWEQTKVYSQILGAIDGMDAGDIK